MTLHPPLCKYGFCLLVLHMCPALVLHMGQGNPKHRYRLDDVWIDSSPAEKDLRGSVDEKLMNTSQQCALSPKSQSHPGMHQRKCGQQDEADDSATPLSSHETPSGVLRPPLASPMQERQGSAQAGQEEGQEDDQRLQAPCL